MDEGFLEKSQAQLLPAALSHRPGSLLRAPAGTLRTKVEGVRVQHPMGLMAMVVATKPPEL